MSMVVVMDDSNGVSWHVRSNTVLLTGEGGRKGEPYD